MEVFAADENKYILLYWLGGFQGLDNQDWAILNKKNVLKCACLPLVFGQSSWFSLFSPLCYSQPCGGVLIIFVFKYF